MRIQATDERHYLVEVFTKLGFNQDDSQLLADLNFKNKLATGLK